MSGPIERPVGRLAPSPTGLLHIGHARSFLLAWWHLRSRGGRVHLRIEDLDRERSRPEYVDGCLRDLEWLGMDWDGRETYQSASLAAMEQAVQDLVRQGDVYPCICSRREISAASAPHASDAEVRYPGTCRGRFADLAAAQAASGGPAGLRFVVPAGEVPVRDGFAGDHATDVQAEVGDFLVARRDGVFAYQLAVVVDDARQGVTEVLRGDDLLSSTPRQALLQRALHLASPDWYHVPLVVDGDGRRLAKRDGDLSLTALRERGVDPRRIVGWVAATAGLEEVGDIEAIDAAGLFELERVPRAPAVFDAVARARLGAP